MDDRIAEVLGRALGEKIKAWRRVGGGDINEAFAVELEDGRRLFLKRNIDAPRGMFKEEARGLRWLTSAGGLRVPRGISWSETMLVMELIEAGPPAPDFDERLGRGLAAIHRYGTPRFGLGHDNFIGRLPQDNSQASDKTWATFYRERRLEAQLRRAVDEGHATARMRSGFERLFAALPDLVGQPEPPALLHGDLWGGNLLCDETGAPCLCDPAVYGGHREIDLAMMRLFGGFGPRVFAAYHEAFPLSPGHESRVAVYQLYPLMVHVNLFAGSYISQVESLLDRLA